MPNKTALLVVTDLGRFRAFRYEANPRFSTPRLQVIEEWETEVHAHLSEQLSDQAGQFQKGSRSFGGVNDGASGERHNLKLELERRALKKVANRIRELLALDGLETCYLAAGHEINPAVLEALDPQTRGRVERNVTANLTRLSVPEILDHFQAAAKT